VLELLTLQQVRQAVTAGPLEARVHVQLETVAAKFTREQKPYCELTLADAGDRMTLRVWSDHPNFNTCDTMQNGDFVEIIGEFYQHQQYGLDVRRWTTRPLTADERGHLLQGPSELRAKQAADWEFIVATTAAIRDPRLYALSAEFIAQHGARFRNTAGARTYHHARRGGLLEHTAQMMRVATQIAPAYPQLNLDLLVAGILFHDCGKLWENYLPETGFQHSVRRDRRAGGAHRRWPRGGECALAQTGGGRARRRMAQALSANRELPAALASPYRLPSWRAAVWLAGLSKNTRGVRSSLHRQSRRPPGDDSGRLSRRKTARPENF